MKRREGCYIKIELAGKKNKYEDCVLEIEDSGIVEIICKNVEKKKDLIDLISGAQVTSGTCILEDVNTNQHLSEYKKIVDIIDLDRVDSTLSVRNYLVFFTMITGVYCDRTLDELTQLFVQNGIEDLLDKTLNELNREEKIKVRCLAAYIKGIRCLVGKELLENMEKKQRECMISFLKKYFCENQCLCILFENIYLQEHGIDATFVI